MKNKTSLLDLINVQVGYFFDCISIKVDTIMCFLGFHLWIHSKKQDGNIDSVNRECYRFGCFKKQRKFLGQWEMK